jgi:cell division cycle protein 37
MSDVVDTQDDKLVRTVAKQTVTIQYILELAKSLKRDARDCFNAFFARMATAQEEYTAAYNDEINSLIERVKDRAHVRLQLLGMCLDS